MSLYMMSLIALSIAGVCVLSVLGISLMLSDDDRIIPKDDGMIDTFYRPKEF